MVFGDDIYSQLSAYIDGELSEEEDSVISSAIELDPKLADECEQLGKLRQLVRQNPIQPAPSDFTQRVLDTIERDELTRDVAVNNSPASRVSFWKKAIAASAVLLITASAAIIITVTNQSGTPETENVVSPDDSAVVCDLGQDSKAVLAPLVLSEKGVLTEFGAVTVASITTGDLKLTRENIINNILQANGAKVVLPEDVIVSSRSCGSSRIYFTVNDSPDGLRFVVVGSADQLEKIKCALNQLATRVVDISSGSAEDIAEVASILTDNKDALDAKPTNLSRVETVIAKDIREKTEQEKLLDMIEERRRCLPPSIEVIRQRDKDTHSAPSPKAKTDDVNIPNGKLIQAIYIRVN